MIIANFMRLKCLENFKGEIEMKLFELVEQIVIDSEMIDVVVWDEEKYEQLTEEVILPLLKKEKSIMRII